MQIIWLNGKEITEINEPIYVLVKRDGSVVYAGAADEAGSFHGLLQKANGNEEEYEQYIFFEGEEEIFSKSKQRKRYCHLQSGA